MASPTRLPQSVWQVTSPFPTATDSLSLSANAAKSWTCPSGTDAVLIGSTVFPLYIEAGATAAVISGDVTDGTASMLITGPSMFTVEQGVAYSFICASNALVGIARYKA